MIKVDVDLSGEETFPTLTKGNISRLTRSVASRVRKAVMSATPVFTGETRKSWTPVRKVSGGYSFSNPLVQADVLDKGSSPGQKPWPSPGPRTTLYRGKIYSSQAPGGILYTADVERIANEVASELFEKMFK
jgi:hypothetical protein